MDLCANRNEVKSGLGGLAILSQKSCEFLRLLFVDGEKVEKLAFLVALFEFLLYQLFREITLISIRTRVLSPKIAL